MQDELQSLFHELHQLAQQRQWDSVVTMTELLNSLHTGDTLLLATQSESNLPLFQQWLQRRQSVSSSNFHLLPRLFQEPHYLQVTDKVLMLLECGRMIEAEETTFALQCLFTRPRGTYALVFTHAELLTTAQEFEQFEHTLRRLFFSDLPTWQEPEELFTQNIFFWSDTSVHSSLLQDRLRRDNEALANWLDLPLAADVRQQLGRHRYLFALSLAEQHITQAQMSAEDIPDPDRQSRIRNQTLQEVQEVEERILHLIDTQYETLQETLQRSYNTLRLDLQDGLALYLEDDLSLLTLNEEAFAQKMVNYVDAGNKTWFSRMEPDIETSQNELLQALQECVQIINWPSVNAMLATKDNYKSYPEVFLESWHTETFSEVSAGDIPAPSLTGSVAQIPSRQPQRKRQTSVLPLKNIMKDAAIGAVLAAAVALVLRWDRKGVFAVAAIGSGLGGLRTLIDRKPATDQSEGAEEERKASYELYGQECIRMIMAGIIVAVSDKLQDYRKVLKGKTSSDFTLLKHRLQQVQLPDTTDLSIDDDLELLSSWYQRIYTLELTEKNISE